MVNSFLIASLPRCAEPSVPLSPTHEHTQSFLFFPLPVYSAQVVSRTPATVAMPCDAMRVCVYAPFIHSLTHPLIDCINPHFSLSPLLLRAVCLTQPSITSSLSPCVCVCVCVVCVTKCSEPPGLSRPHIHLGCLPSSHPHTQRITHHAPHTHERRLCTSIMHSVISPFLDNRISFPS